MVLFKLKKNETSHFRLYRHSVNQSLLKNKSSPYTLTITNVDFVTKTKQHKIICFSLASEIQYKLSLIQSKMNKRKNKFNNNQMMKNHNKFSSRK